MQRGDLHTHVGGREVHGEVGAATGAHRGCEIGHGETGRIRAVNGDARDGEIGGAVVRDGKGVAGIGADGHRTEVVGDGVIDKVRAEGLLNPDDGKCDGQSRSSAVECDLSLRQGSAIHRAEGVHHDGCSGQYGSIEDGGRAENRFRAYLPENVIGICAASQNDINRVGHLKIGAALENPDIAWTTTECDVRVYKTRRAAVKFVEARGERQPADINPG